MAKRINLARALRRSDVPAEALFWKAVRNRALGGFKFRRQHPIGPYVVDFTCIACKVVVELDGETHLTSRRTDTKRAQILESAGWRVLRFWNSEVYDELEMVKEAVYATCSMSVKFSAARCRGMDRAFRSLASLPFMSSLGLGVENIARSLLTANRNDGLCRTTLA